MTKESMIKEIQRLRSKSLSYQKIADNFNKRKIQTISGRGKWGKGSIGRILSKTNDPLYTQDTNKNSQVQHQRNSMLKELNRVKQTNIDLHNQLNKIKQQNEELLNELNKVKQMKAELYKKLNKVKHDEEKQSKEKVKMSIDGWNVQKSGGYYRLFRKIAGKVHGIYLGKTINEDVAKNKINNYTQGIK